MTCNLRQSEKIFDRITAALYDNEKEQPRVTGELAAHRIKTGGGSAIYMTEV